MTNIENLDVFEILTTQKLVKCPKDPFLRSALILFSMCIAYCLLNVLEKSNVFPIGDIFYFGYLFLVLQFRKCPKYYRR